MKELEKWDIGKIGKIEPIPSGGGKTSLITPLVPSERLAAYGVLVAIELIFVAFCLDTHNEGAAKSNASMLCWLSRNREALVIRVRDPSCANRCRFVGASRHGKNELFASFATCY